MAILRNPNKGKFTVVDNYAMRDKSLSLKARGLLVSMLSLPDDWKFSEDGLCVIFPLDGQASIRSGLKELERLGYLSRERSRDEHGRMAEVIWTICDYPRLENPSMDNPSVEKPNLENPPQYNTNTSNTNKPKTKERNTNRFMPPSLDDVRAYCQERMNSVSPERFVDYYTSNGWRVGKNPMKDWKAAVRNWEGNSRSKTQQEEGNPFLEILREEEAKKYGQSRDCEDYVTF